MDSLQSIGENPLVLSSLEVIGAITAVVILYRLLGFIYMYSLRPGQLRTYLVDTKAPNTSKNALTKTSSETKSWALITGASDGIGKALAHQLAQDGFNVVLHGRNPTKLDGVLQELKKTNLRTHFHVLIANASHSHMIESSVSNMTQTLNALPGPLTLLINNVGGTSPIPRVFMPLRELDSNQVDGLVALNALFTVQLTRALLPGMLERSTKYGTKATIVNIGSMAQIGVPMQSVYGGSKTFVRAFTLALARELKLEGYIGVSAMYTVVGRVTDAGPWRKASTFFMPSAVTMARAVLNAVGSGRLEVTPYWPHAVQYFFASSIPESLLTRLSIDEVRGDMAEEEEKAKNA